MCAKVCPAHAIEVRKEEKRVTIYANQCIQCEQCVEVCPFGCIWMTENFLTANTDRYADE
jgi:formate hydrogenlyase subunit 6/NADH:ubiquinone oxidoreductase subunit I